MFHLDNNSGVSAMPPVGAVQSSAPRWFTEGGGGVPASYPGAAWYNIIQAELLNLAAAYGITPDKTDLNQLQKAIEAAISQKATAKSPLLAAIAALTTAANKMPYFTGKDTVAMTDLTAFARTLLGRSDAAGVLSDLQLKEAAKRDVGTGTNQIPDMNSFTSGPGWVRYPDGTIIQTGTSIVGPLASPTAISFPVPFTQMGYKVTTSFDQASGSSNDCPSFAVTPQAVNWAYFMSSRTNGLSAGCNWIAIGR